MATRRVATVFGGSGFIGRYIVKRLAKAGYVVRVAVRDTEGAHFLRPMGAVGQIVPLYASFHEPATITRAVAGAEAVVNAVGILAESRDGDFQRVHADAPGQIARDATAAGCARLVHISAIGADPASRSRYGRSKGLGEQAVSAGFASAVVLRPSIVFGPEDQFFNRFAGLARFAPVMPVISGDTRLQPVYVGNVADAVMAGLTRDAVQGRTFELGGPKVWTFRALLAWILEETGRHRRLFEVPPGLAGLQAAVMEKLPGKPLTRDQLLMLAQDNVVSAAAAGLEQLGITPTPVELVVPDYLTRFRKGSAARARYDTLQNSSRP